jgi:uncharacterized membrane protein
MRAMEHGMTVFPLSWQIAGWLVCAAALAIGVRGGALRPLADASRLNLFLAAAVVLMVFWQIRTGVRPGLSFHLLGVTAVTLMFGFTRGWLAGGLAALSAVFTGRADWAGLGLELVFFALLPAAVAHGVKTRVEMRLPGHFFLYILVNGFFGAALAVLLAGVVSTAAFVFAGVYDFALLRATYLPYFILLAWGEAFTTGMVVTMMAVYHPAWLESFDEARYITHK